MYKTSWLYETKDAKITIFYYHFGKNPQFPHWYLPESDCDYTIELIASYKLIVSPTIFLKCLFHHCIIREN